MIVWFVICIRIQSIAFTCLCENDLPCRTIFLQSEWKYMLNLSKFLTVEMLHIAYTTFWSSHIKFWILPKYVKYSAYKIGNLYSIRQHNASIGWKISCRQTLHFQWEIVYQWIKTWYRLNAFRSAESHRILFLWYLWYSKNIPLWVFSSAKIMLISKQNCKQASIGSDWLND